MLVFLTSLSSSLFLVFLSLPLQNVFFIELIIAMCSSQKRYLETAVKQTRTTLQETANHDNKNLFCCPCPDICSPSATENLANHIRITVKLRSAKPIWAFPFYFIDFCIGQIAIKRKHKTRSCSETRSVSDSISLSHFRSNIGRHMPSKIDYCRFRRRFARRYCRTWHLRKIHDPNDILRVALGILSGYATVDLMSAIFNLVKEKHTFTPFRSASIQKLSFPRRIAPNCIITIPCFLMLIALPARDILVDSFSCYLLSFFALLPAIAKWNISERMFKIASRKRNREEFTTYLRNRKFELRKK